MSEKEVLASMADVPLGEGVVQMLNDFGRDNIRIPLRDHFAGLAMQGWIANVELGGMEDHYIAKKAYEIADQMLRAREAK